MPRPQTPTRGAADLASSVIAKIKRMRAEHAGDERVRAVLIHLQQWIEAWDLRAASKKGGLGRKKPVKQGGKGTWIDA